MEIKFSWSVSISSTETQSRYIQPGVNRQP